MLRLGSPMIYVDASGRRASRPRRRGRRRRWRSRGAGARARDRGREIELIVVPGAGHVFNFKQPDLAQQAWDATVGWLRAHLPPT